MQDYIRETGSVMIVLSRCAATTAEPDNGHRKFYAFLLNPKACERAHTLRRLASDGCKQATHRRLRGVDDQGIPHSRHAEEYPPIIAEGVAELHTSTPDDKTAADNPKPPRRPPPLAPAKSGQSKSAGQPVIRDRHSEATSAGAASDSVKQSGTRDESCFSFPRVHRRVCRAGGPLVLLEDNLLPTTSMPGGVTTPRH